ncbi:MAG: ArsR family transcriptional regulator [Candidatus Lokiarchaeota archaeon]|nr:ArsR family transcriptional regulator [Candidatus Lokiarchaeota archaeon]
MTTEFVYEHLIEALNLSFSEITSIMKALGNEKRLQILILLLKGPQPYAKIVFELELKKTAVSNHLTQLMEVNLISREGNGVYIITGDGLKFIKAIEQAYQQSPSQQLKKFESLERRGISSSFLNRFPQP